MSQLLTFLFTLNSISFIGSLIYFFIPEPSIVANIYGGVLILTLTGNIVAATFLKGNKKWRFTYLILSSLGLFCVMVLNTLTSIDPTNHSSQSLLSLGLILLHFLGGAWLSGRSISAKEKPSQVYSLKSNQSKHAYRKTRRTFLGLLSFLLFIGVLLALIMLTRLPVALIEAGLSPYSLFYSLIFLSLAGLALNLVSVKKHRIITYTLGSVGVGLYILFALPFLSIPSMLDKAETNYTKVFGQSAISMESDVPAFRDLPVSIPAFFFGSPSKDYALEEDVVYYEGSDGVDDGLTLAFDAYSPPENARNLPGEGSVLIRIHGGGWGTGDKGAFNFAQINKYFASQGYVVFDVQYGLDDHNQSALFLSGPDEVYGSFSVDDMVRHLGIFTTYLADNKEAFGANLDSVFISGGSAGGQLANAVALASSSENYDELIDSRISVKGLIPLYPANDLSHFRDIGGQDALVDPALLAEEDSPPALLFQGDKDGIVVPQVSRNFRDAYLAKNNNDIAIIWMPYGAHVSDIYFSGFYNQTFMYYMERFMYQYK